MGTLPSCRCLEQPSGHDWQQHWRVNGSNRISIRRAKPQRPLRQLLHQFWSLSDRSQIVGGFHQLKASFLVILFPLSKGSNKEAC